MRQKGLNLLYLTVDVDNRPRRAQEVSVARSFTVDLSISISSLLDHRVGLYKYPTTPLNLSPPSSNPALNFLSNTRTKGTGTCRNASSQSRSASGGIPSSLAILVAPFVLLVVFYLSLLWVVVFFPFLFGLRAGRGFCCRSNGTVVACAGAAFASHSCWTMEDWLLW